MTTTSNSNSIQIPLKSNYQEHQPLNNNYQSSVNFNQFNAYYNNQNEFEQLLLTANKKQFCNILQTQFYYEGINDLQYSQYTQDSTPKNQNNKSQSAAAFNKQKQVSKLKDSLQDPEEQRLIQQKLEDQQRQLQDADMFEINEQEQYFEQFRDSNQKKPKIGQNYQVHDIPLITDIQDFEYLQYKEQRMIDQCHVCWDPSKISEEALKEYLKNIELIWPHDIYHYQEESALLYLLLKNYDVQLALTSILYNHDELVKLLMIIKRKKKREGFLTNKLVKQTNKLQSNSRVLRDRKNYQSEDSQDKEYFQ
ncbi:UNKNOWN [Stylonychia lemnae]|uniref:ELM2 domain-containing protein n=1 Tax=Stylonychia lemnae TaxID=5949 RepID=A0A078A369_STYLE|nr:UNKNOWN [Stylonychia lemnae]|eukprot:CDW75948.1 UNKNOWN [Stylonychia lemnae]